MPTLQQPNAELRTRLGISVVLIRFNFLLDDGSPIQDETDSGAHNASTDTRRVSSLTVYFIVNSDRFCSFCTQLLYRRY